VVERGSLISDVKISDLIEARVIPTNGKLFPVIPIPQAENDVRSDQGVLLFRSLAGEESDSF
jgi:hypothetical protein